MFRFFCPKKNISGNRIQLDDAATLHHLRDVVRIEPGETMEVFDESGNKYRAALEKLEPSRAVLTVTHRIEGKEKNFFCAVACALPKHSKFDDIVDKLTQTGVDVVIPMVTEHTVVKVFSEKKERKQARWEAIALSAVQQSGRSSIPRVSEVTKFKDVIASAENFDCKIIPHLGKDRKPLKEALGAGSRVLALIGPEGDFTEQEIEQASAAGFVPVSFPTPTLRVETAAVFIASAIAYEFSSR